MQHWNDSRLTESNNQLVLILDWITPIGIEHGLGVSGDARLWEPTKFILKIIIVYAPTYWIFLSHRIGVFRGYLTISKMNFGTLRHHLNLNSRYARCYIWQCSIQYNSNQLSRHKEEKRRVLQGVFILSFNSLHGVSYGYTYPQLLLSQPDII